MARYAVDSRVLIYLLAALGSITPISTDTYLPALPAVRQALDASTAEVQATLSVFMFGAVIGQFIMGPLSDHWGRRPCVLACLAIFVVSSVACMLAPSIEILLLARVFQAIGGAGASTLSRTIVRDLFEGWAASREFARMNTMRGLAPLIGPLLGAMLATAFGWRAIFAMMAAFGVLIMVLIFTRLPETMPRQDGKLSFSGMLRDYAEVFSHPRFRFYVAIQTLQFAGFFGFLSGSAFVLQGRYGLTQGEYAIAFSIAVLGFIGGSYLAHRLQGRMSPTAIIRMGIVLAFLGGLGTLAAMGLGLGGVPTIVIATACYLTGMSVASPYCEAGALAPFSGKVGSAASLSAMIQMLFGSIAGLLLGPALDRTILAMPTVEVMATASALILIFFFRPEKTTG